MGFTSKVTRKKLIFMLIIFVLILDYEDVLKKVNEKAALNRIKTKVDKALADEIRELDLMVRRYKEESLV
ncbi:MAG: hypothetical protein ACK5LV_04200 [Lachnospirales bacterium]